MTYDEAKELLKSLEHKKKLCRAKQRQINEEKAQLDIFISAIDYSRVRVQSSGDGNSVQQRYAEKMEEFKARLDKLDSDFEKLLDETFAIEDMVASHLTELEPMEQSVIIERYMHGKSWRVLEDELNYCERHLRRYEHKGLEKIIKS